MMKDSTCAYEGKVAKALLSGPMDGELRYHVSSCPICQEIVNVSGWMQTLATAPPEPTLPDAGTLWNLARQQERKSAERRVTRTLVIVRIGACLVVALGMGGWLIFHWPELQTEIARSSSSLLLKFGETLSVAVRPLAYVMIILFGLNTVLTLRSFRAQRRLKP